MAPLRLQIRRQVLALAAGHIKSGAVSRCRSVLGVLGHPAGQELSAPVAASPQWLSLDLPARLLSTSGGLTRRHVGLWPKLIKGGWHAGEPAA